MPPEKIDSNNYEQSRRHFLKIITFRCLKTLKNLLVNIVEVAIISVGMSVQDVVLTMFIIFPSSNECKAYLTLAPFTVVSAYFIVKNPYCVTGFDIIRDYIT